jgi:hypothetical protein
MGREGTRPSSVPMHPAASEAAGGEVAVGEAGQAPGAGKDETVADASANEDEGSGRYVPV